MDFEARFARLEETVKHLQEQLRDVLLQNEAVNKINTSVELLSQRIEQLNNSIDRFDVRLAEIEKKPAKRWDDLIKQIIALVVGSVFGYVLNNILS